jgi:hypothetical protein
LNPSKRIDKQIAGLAHYKLQVGSGRASAAASRELQPGAQPGSSLGAATLEAGQRLAMIEGTLWPFREEKSSLSVVLITTLIPEVTVLNYEKVGNKPIRFLVALCYLLY